MMYYVKRLRSFDKEYQVIAAFKLRSEADAYVRGHQSRESPYQGACWRIEFYES